MHHATSRPKRMRCSYEARCRAVDAMLAGVSPRDAAAGGGTARAPLHPEAPAASPLAGRGGRDRGRPRAQRRGTAHAWRGTAHAWRDARPSGLDRRQGAQAARPLAAAARTAAPDGALRARAPGRTDAHRHQEAGGFWNVGKRILGDGITRSPRAGWQHVHVAVDDHSRLAYAEVLASDRRHHALASLERTLDWFGEQGVTVEAVMTDNGAAYASHAWRARCDELGLRHPRTRPNTHAPTARRSASSRCCCAAGRPPSPTRRARTAREPSQGG